MPGLESRAESLEEAERSSVELAQYALALFITHYPRARKLPIPRLEEAQPQHVKPARAETAAALDNASLLGAFGDEAQLDWYREDAQDAGVRVPDLERPAAWKVLPSKRR